MGLNNEDTTGDGHSFGRLYDEKAKILEFQKSGLSDARIDITRLSGDEQGVAQLVNQIITLFINEQEGITSTIGKILDGNFSGEIPRLPGSRGILSDRLGK